MPATSRSTESLGHGKGASDWPAQVRKMAISRNPPTAPLSDTSAMTVAAPVAS